MTPLFATMALASVLATAPAPAEGATSDASAPDPSTPDAATERYPVRLSLTTDALTKHTPADVVKSNDHELRTGLVDMFGLKGVDVVERAEGAAVIDVELTWENPKTSTYDVKVSCTRPDGGTHSLAFEILGDHFDVLMRIDAEMPTVLRWLDVPEPTGAPPPVGLPPAEDGVPPEPPPGETDARRIGPMGWTGVGLLAAGLGPLVAGAVLLPRTRSVMVQVDTGSGFEPRTEIVRKHPLALTATLVGVGGLLVGTGVGLLATDLIRRKRRRASLAFSPSFAPGHFGATITRRF